MLTRKNVWELGSEWADEILWYARGVEVLKARSLETRTSWRFYAAMHGISRTLWTISGDLVANELPTNPTADMTRFWSQCQHGSWFFLPWHRGYLWAFEAIVRDAIVGLGGPPDWALPYWNYFKAGQNALPAEFAKPDWPDGVGNNPLFVPQRYGPNGDGNVFVELSLVNLNAMTEDDFAGSSSGGPVGFGGLDTGFAHNGQTHGAIESQPHDWVHGLVGGGTLNANNQELPGLMSHPRSAGLDPIFWLHHANIDRLWEVWRRDANEPHTDPTESLWRDGPASIGERPFEMPMFDGSVWTFKPDDVADLVKLDYTYDDLPVALTPSPVAFNPAAAMTSTKKTELLGASQNALSLEGNDARAAVQIDQGVKETVLSSFSATPSPPERVFLNLENVSGKSDATAFRVYVGLPTGEEPASHPERHAGDIALFGVSDASDVNAEHGGGGLTFVLDITKIMKTLDVDGALSTNSVDVRLVPIRPVPKEAQISVGRISIYRQAGK